MPRSAVLVIFLLAVITALVAGQGEKKTFGGGYRRPVNKRFCPYCDSSVYSYCSDKLLHDACCCSDPYGSSSGGGGGGGFGNHNNNYNQNNNYNPYNTRRVAEFPLPYECRVADCSFLHANSCDEHNLITACCCSDLFFAKKK